MYLAFSFLTFWTFSYYVNIKQGFTPLRYFFYVNSSPTPLGWQKHAVAFYYLLFLLWNQLKSKKSYWTTGAIAEYTRPTLCPLGGILWRTSQNTIEVILMQIDGPVILQFSGTTDKNYILQKVLNSNECKQRNLYCLCILDLLHSTPIFKWISVQKIVYMEPILFHSRLTVGCESWCMGIAQPALSRVRGKLPYKILLL